jgi:uncharacterized protein
VDSILWRRLDCPGHDACYLERVSDGWRIDGTAIFREHGAPARLAYQVACDAEWRTQDGHVVGWLGPRSVEFRVRRTEQGKWSLNGQPVPNLDDCLDLDFGFTPATNVLQRRRAALHEGQSAEIPVAWLDVQAGTLERLAQRYSRRGVTTHWYEAARFGYSALLEVNVAGFIVRYPGLWEEER